jgi:hypothetical protein
MNKEEIISEIRRTAKANGGAVLGSKRFERETGIGYCDWFGVHWARWGDAIREAGLEPNQLQGAYDTDHLLEQYARLANELGRIPVMGDLRLRRRNDPQFPSWNTFSRFGTKVDMAKTLLEFCRLHPEFGSVAEQCLDYLQSPTLTQVEKESPNADEVAGYVYLMKHGCRREYKIGRTNNPLRREGELRIQLPEELRPVHYIRTDDPAGIEAYWHARFASKRKEGEWFALAAQDVRAFKRWKRIY